MASLTGTKINDTYDGLLKTSDNGGLGATEKLITDGLGNSSGVYLGTSGNVGIGVSPKTQYSTVSSFQLSTSANIFTLSGQQNTLYTTNEYLESGTATSKYISDGYAMRYQQTAGEHRWSTAVSGLSEETITWSESMRIDSSGNVGIGVSPSKRFEVNVNGTADLMRFTRDSGTNGEMLFDFSGANSNFRSTQGGFVWHIGSTPTERMRIDSSGNVKLTSEGYQLAIQDQSSGNISEVLSSNNAMGFFADRANAIADSYMLFSVDGSERMRITSSGNMWLLGTAPNAEDTISNLEFYNNTSGIILASITGKRTAGGSNYGSLIFNTTNSGTSSEKMRITSGGAVIIGTGGAFSAGSGNIQINRSPDGGYIQTSSTLTTAVDHHYFYNPNGLVGRIETSGSSTSYITTSDYRLKENVVEMTGALDRVNALKPSRFNFIADPEKTVDGFLAHEVAEVVPEAISGEKDATEEYEVTPAEYKTVVVTPAQEAVYETIEHPAIAEELDADGNIIVEAQEAWTEEVLVSEAVEEVTEQVLVSEAVMGTRPVYQGIDQSKIVPLLTAGLQEAHEMIKQLEARIAALEAK